MSRSPLFALTPLLAILASCSRSQPAEPEPPPEPVVVDAGIPHMSLGKALGMAMGMGSEKPPSPPTPTDADFVKVGKREPDWDLDPTDPASDYAERYIQATNRYTTERTCVHAQPSRVEGGRTLVDTRDTPPADRAAQGADAPSSNGCKGSNAVRDTFAVDVPHDLLELADPSRGAPLGEWPDGSTPRGMPTPSPKEGPQIKEWKSPITKALEDLQLVPLRVQFYGRGSYPLVSIAGWHATVTMTSTPAELAAAAQKICKASAGFPLGVIVTRDRGTVLRFKCGGTTTTRWDHL